MTRGSQEPYLILHPGAECGLTSSVREVTSQTAAVGVPGTDCVCVFCICDISLGGSTVSG